MSETKNKVLVIEDDPLILDIIVFKFKAADWEVVSAMDGETGMEKVKETCPDIILLDILLPGISGYEVMKELKADAECKKIPILVLSNYGQKEEIEKSVELGAVDHLVKANIIIDEVVGLAEDVIKGDYSSAKK